MVVSLKNGERAAYLVYEQHNYALTSVSVTRVPGSRLTFIQDTNKKKKTLNQKHKKQNNECKVKETVIRRRF